MNQEATQDMIDIFTTDIEERGEGFFIYRGHTMRDLADFTQFVPVEYVERIDWKDSGYRAVWVNDDNLSIMAYCEGDISITRHDRRESFDCEIENATKFYSEY